MRTRSRRARACRRSAARCARRTTSRARRLGTEPSGRTNTAATRWAVRAWLDNQLVVERDDRLEGPGISLATAAPGKLPVDAPSFVPLGRDDVQSPRVGDTGPQADVGAPPGHVRRHGDLIRLTRLGDQLRFVRVLPGVQQLMTKSGRS